MPHKTGVLALIGTMTVTQLLEVMEKKSQAQAVRRRPNHHAHTDWAHADWARVHPARVRPACSSRSCDASAQLPTNPELPADFHASNAALPPIYVTTPVSFNRSDFSITEAPSV